MPRGKIAGFPRPLAEDELIMYVLLDTTEEYGMRLEDDDFRSNEEDKMEQLLEDTIGRKADDMAIKLSPAGAVAVKVALGSDEIFSFESRAKAPNVPEMKRFFEKARNTISGLDGYLIPSPAKGFGDGADGFVYRINTK